MDVVKVFSLLLAMFAVAPVNAANLERDFASPPDATRPRCYWYWMDGHITKEGITHDLEAMRRVGIGEGYIGIISGQTSLGAGDGPKALTDPWWQFIEHAIREGDRLGVDVGLFNSPGWSQSGGPWVKPKQAMRYLVMPETRLRGPKRFEGKLPTPQGDYQDVRVLAFPAPASDAEKAKASSRTPTAVTWESPAPLTARSITVRPDRPVNVAAELQASDDGKTYRTIKRFVIDRHNLGASVGPVPLAPIVATFPATTARFFRLTLSSPGELGEIELSPAARVENYAEKSLAKVFQDPQPPFDFYSWPRQAEPDQAGLIVKSEAVQDISKQLSADGTLRWDVPAGEWIVLRVAMTPTGTKNGPAPAEATGLEVDKMNREALRSHFDAYVGNLLKRMPAADRKAFKHVVADSYEMGPENWTDGFAEEFRRRYGYDPIPFLPVMTGRVVGSVDQSDRFLWDLRRLVADRVASNYVGGLRDLCHEQGLRMWLENYGHWGFPGEFLQYGGQCDEISGEFWATGNLGDVELRDAASAAHTYGMPTVWAEAFTGGPAFVNTPRDLKARGDWAFCEGINQFVLHVYIHQPWDDRRPGVNAWFGTEFNRQNTWFEYARPWVDYLRRCSVMLQAGNPVADVAYYIGEDAPKMAGIRKPELPAGHDYDYINAEVIENRLAVKDGRFVLPNGTTYRLLVLPESATMRPAVLKKIQQLALAGGAILGPKPGRSPSLENFPACDAEVKRLADELWSEGRVTAGVDLPEMFRKLKLSADILCPKDVLWKHRKDGDTDIYFLSNQQPLTRTEVVSFRVDGRKPEFWWPESGRMESATAYELRDGRVQVPIQFGPNTSVFVVFRHKTTESLKPDKNDKNDKKRPGSLEIVSAVYEAVDGAGKIDVTKRLAGMIVHDQLTVLVANHTMGHEPALNHAKHLRVDYRMDGRPGATIVAEGKTLTLAAGRKLPGPWLVTFDPKAGGPEKPVSFETLDDWSKRPEPGIRYYSGAATYKTEFQVSNLEQAKLLDLGEVHAIAVVRVNGKDVGSVWKQPYTVDISKAVKLGANVLEITVVNTWLNRLVGDEQPGVAKRTTFVAGKICGKDTALQPAGLLGPVTVY